jgi:hypothetical protein
MSRRSVSLLVLSVGLASLLELVGPRVPISTVEPPSLESPLPAGAVARLRVDWPRNYIADIRFSPDGEYLAAGMYERGVILWRVADRKPLREVPGYWADSFDFSPGQETARYSVPNFVHFLRFARDGRRLFVVFDQGTRVHLLDLETGAIRALYDKLVLPNGASVTPSQFDFSERTMALGIASWGPPPLLVDCRGDRPAVRLSPDGTLLITLGGEPLRAFRAPTGEPVPIAETWPAERAAFSPDGRRIAYMGSCDDCVRFMDLATGTFANPPFNDRPRLTSLAFAPDGRTMATGCVDGSILLWNVTGLDFRHRSERDAMESVFAARSRSPVGSW